MSYTREKQNDISQRTPLVASTPSSSSSQRRNPPQMPLTAAQILASNPRTSSNRHPASLSLPSSSNTSDTSDSTSNRESVEFYLSDGAGRNVNYFLVSYFEKSDWLHSFWFLFAAELCAAFLTVLIPTVLDVTWTQTSTTESTFPIFLQNNATYHNNNALDPNLSMRNPAVAIGMALASSAVFFLTLVYARGITANASFILEQFALEVYYELNYYRSGPTPSRITNRNSNSNDDGDEDNTDMKPRHRGKVTMFYLFKMVFAMSAVFVGAYLAALFAFNLLLDTNLYQQRVNYFDHTLTVNDWRVIMLDALGQFCLAVTLNRFYRSSPQGHGPYMEMRGLENVLPVVAMHGVWVLLLYPLTGSLLNPLASFGFAMVNDSSFHPFVLYQSGQIIGVICAFFYSCSMYHMPRIFPNVPSGSWIVYIVVFFAKLLWYPVTKCRRSSENRDKYDIDTEDGINEGDTACKRCVKRVLHGFRLPSTRQSLNA